MTRQQQYDGDLGQDAPMDAAAAAGLDHDDAGVQLPTDGQAVEACYSSAGDVMATATSSGVIQVWAVQKSGWGLSHTAKLQAAPTHMAWAHPQYGQLLAAGTSTGHVHIIQGPAGPSSSSGGSGRGDASSVHRDQQQRTGWSSTAQLQCGKGPVSALAFGPHQHGLVLAAACSRQQPSSSTATGSSYVQLWEAAGKAGSCSQWTLVSRFELPASAGSCRCLCWRESAPGLPPLLLVGHDAGGSIWGYNSPNMMLHELGSFRPPAGAAGSSVLSVHWAPALGRPYELAAASFGTTVALLKVQPAAAGDGAHAAALEQQRQLGQLEVVELQLLSLPAPVWRLEFSMLGTTLAASLDGRPEVWLFMPMLDGAWQAVSKLGGGEDGRGGGQEDDGIVVD